jgi:hypothetical protein
VVDGRAVLRFTRPLAGTGKLAAVGFNGSTSILHPSADVIWAVGAYDDDGGDDDSDTTAAAAAATTDATGHGSAAASVLTCGYHESALGLRIVNWERPQATFDDAWRCSNQPIS